MIEAQTSESEQVGRHGHVGLPHSIGHLADDAHCLMVLLLEPAPPGVQRECAMLTQALDVSYLEAAALRRSNALLNRRHFGIGKDVTVRERSKLRLTIARADPLVPKYSTRGKQSDGTLIIGRQVRTSDLFHHTDADDLVVEHLPLHVPKVSHLDAAAPRQPGGDDLLVGDLRLPPTQRDAMHERAMHLGCIECEASPAAADVEDPVARLQA